ncbi:MAG: GDSL-type esterase/lipase family protein [Ignavibacteriaceae bacterium]|nr:GDSL-type esterase/lipase family protein [Ignavibacteriaceae bacterium]
MKKIILLYFLLALPLSAQILPIKVACIGNSITIGAGLADPTKAYPQQAGILLGSGYEVQNFGVSGRTMLKKGDYPYWNEPQFQAALNFKPQILTICLGTNDSKPWNWIYKNDFFSNYSEMISDFRKDNPNLQVYVCFPPPGSANGAGISDSVIHYQIIPIIDSVRKTSNTFVIDFYDQMINDLAYFPDGIHPNVTGHAIMANIVYHTILNSPAGIIRQFSPKSYVFEKGDSVTLYWLTTKNSNSTIDGKGMNDTDSLTVYPTGTTTYTLITNGTVKDTAKVTLQYVHPGIIKSFTVDNPILDKGYHESRILKWATSNGSTVKLNGADVKQNDSLVVNPDSTTSYTLITNGDTSNTSTLTINVLEANTINRALLHVAAASQFVNGYPAAFAVDGDTTTYWQSQVANPQWITVDMKDTYTINRVVVHWEKVFATSFQLAVISEKGDTTKIYSTTNGTGGINDISGLEGTGRYLSLLCTGRNYPTFGYRLKELEAYGVPPAAALVSNRNNIKPAAFSLAQNYPNPFNPSTVIKYNLAAGSFVKLKVYDILGNEIATLVNEFQNSGSHSVLFNARQTANHNQLSSGVYFYRISAVSKSGQNENFIDTKKLILMK